MATSKATSGTTTGISESGVKQIQTAITEYIGILQKTIDVSAKPAKIQQAIKGTKSEASLMKMNQDLNEKLIRLTNTLKKYNTSLDTMLANYRKNDAGNTAFSNISKGLK